MLPDVGSKMMQTILRGHGSAMDLKMILSENQTTLIGSDPTVAVLVDNVIDAFLLLSLLNSSDSPNSAQHLNNNMLGSSSAKGKEVANAIEHATDDSPDAFKWRKYGKKNIKNCTHPRRYYRCSGGKKCTAKKWVQMFEDNPLMSKTNYNGVHTCETEKENLFYHQFPTYGDVIPLGGDNIVHQGTAVCDDQFGGSEFQCSTYGAPMFFNKDFGNHF